MRYILFFCLAWFRPLSVFALVNGRPLISKPDVVRLEFNERDSICSGFFIKPTMILTSAHCLYSWRDGKEAKLTGIKTAEEKKLTLEVLELILHPGYSPGWATHDLAIIRVSPNPIYEGSFTISTEEIPRWGTVVYFGAGKVDMEKKVYGRATGEANYFKLHSYILGFGPSRSTNGASSSIAANDSGSPVIQKETGKVIGVASQSTSITTSGSFLPAISISTSLLEESNRKFIESFTRQLTKK